jgi:serine/threonine protein kinase, bacterial
MFKWFFDLFEKEFQPYTMVANKYKVISLLGKGSYGLSYLVEVIHTGQLAVLKQNRKRKGKIGKKSFEKEAKILSKLNHPAFPSLLDFFEWQDSVFILMERKEGKTVEQLIFQENRKFSEKESFRFLKKVLQVVKVIHEKGIVHMDLRIPNIILNSDEIYIIDFGLAHYLKSKPVSVKKKDYFKVPTIPNDLYELGHFLLFLLYSSYEPGENVKREKSWQDELTLTPLAKKIILKLLQVEAPYLSVDDVLKDVNQLLFSYK